MGLWALRGEEKRLWGPTQQAFSFSDRVQAGLSLLRKCPLPSLSAEAYTKTATADNDSNEIDEDNVPKKKSKSKKEIINEIIERQPAQKPL